jgi:acyl-coenzyme A synthetase/AMP-(fatty) acid ligase
VREFDTYINRCANVLTSLGVARGDRVATVLPNSLVLLAAYWACAKLGAAVVPLSPLLNASGLASLLADATPSVVIAATDQRAMLDEVRDQAVITAARTWVLHDATPGDERAGYLALGPLLAGASEAEPGVAVQPGDLWTLMYTSGTTGMPKGHPAHALHPRDVHGEVGARGG